MSLQLAVELTVELQPSSSADVIALTLAPVPISLTGPEGFFPRTLLQLDMLSDQLYQCTDIFSCTVDLTGATMFSSLDRRCNSSMHKPMIFLAVSLTGRLFSADTCPIRRFSL